MQAWFVAHGFRGTEDGRLRKQVAGGAGSPGHPARRAAPRALRRRAAAGRRAGRTCRRAAGGDLGPGDEEAGGYVDPEHHRY